VPWGILIGGEELHNNHHSFATSAKLSARWYEFDIGWLYIRILETLGLARVKKVLPKPKFTELRPAVDLDNLQAVITHRYDVARRYMGSLQSIYREELARLRSSLDNQQVSALKRWFQRDGEVSAQDRASIESALAKSQRLETIYAMRRDLTAVWEKSSASREQLVKQLQDWCHRAEQSGIAQLQEFSLRLRRYAV
jgi:stearoyl-CoA desaturase (delta-9 desaturase)